MKLRFIWLFSLVLFLGSCVSLTANFSPADKLYFQAKQFAKEGKRDFVFLSLSELIREYPGYKFIAEARFAVGEYHFLSGNYNKAVNDLVGFLKNYPNHKGSVFAKSFLYKIINDNKWINSEEAGKIAKAIKEEFFSTPAFFVFSEFKEKSLKSLLGNSYSLKEYVDKIEIFANGKLLLSVSL
ncbi:MAG: hypothetical protein AB1629_02735 [Candidatus Omnitrophota bacterium]